MPIRIRRRDKWPHSRISLKRQRQWHYAWNICTVCYTDRNRQIRSYADRPKHC